MRPLTTPSPLDVFLAQADHLQLLFATLLYSQRAAVRPDAVLKTCTPPWFTRGAQHDSDEQLKYLLDKLETEETKASDGNPKQNGHAVHIVMPGSEGQADAATQLQHGGNTELILLDTTPGHTPHTPESKANTVTGSSSSNTANMAHIPNGTGDGRDTPSTAPQGPSAQFCGTLVHEVLCHTCAGVGRREEVFTDLALALSGDSAPSSVADLLSAFLAPEQMSGDDQYWCDACGAKRNAEKRQTITRAPANLVLVLKRFAYDSKTGRVSKVCTRVPLDPTLRVPWGVWG